MQIKILLSIGLTLCLLLLGKIAYDKHQISDTNNLLNEELMKANLEIGKANTKFGDANKYVKELEKAIQEEIKKNKANVTSIGKLKARLSVVNKIKSKTKIVYKDKEILVPQSLDLVPGVLYQLTPNSTLKPIHEISLQFKDYLIDFKGKLISYANTDNNIRFTGNYKLVVDLAATIVKTITSSGAVNHYIDLYTVDKDKKMDKFKINNYEVVVVDQRSHKFYWWVPRLDVGVTATTSLDSNLYAGSIGVSMMGHGKSKDYLNWRFLRLSLDVNNKAAIGLSPAAYNLADLIPVFTNIWVAPHVNRELGNNKYRFGLMLGAVL